MVKMKKILVPIDLSEYSLEAVEYACGLASGSEAQIYLLHVVPIEQPFAFPVVDQHSETTLRDLEEKLLAQLEVFIRRKVCNAKHLVRVIRRGEPSGEIVKFSKDESIDLVVMATHGRTGVGHVLMGSVAEKVVRHSPVPVLTVKPLLIRETLLKEHDIEEQLRLHGQWNK